MDWSSLRKYWLPKRIDCYDKEAVRCGQRNFQQLWDVAKGVLTVRISKLNWLRQEKLYD